MAHLPRRAKGQVLTEELPKLDKLVKRGKKLTDEIIEDRLAKACCTRLHAAETHCFIQVGAHAWRFLV